MRKIHSLTITIQDVETADKKKASVIFGTLFIDNGEFQKDGSGELALDAAGEPVPDYEKIQFTDALHRPDNALFKRCIQSMIVQALTLKDLEIAKRDGSIAHFVQSITGQPLKQGSNPTKPKAKRK